jgi:acetylornithine deacetylase/succinyl-diaminopimelate desuccinylase-like protein
MSTGASDGKILRIAGIPTYGISCMYYEVGENRAHGKDERIGVQDFYDGVEFNYRLIRALSSAREGTSSRRNLVGPWHIASGEGADAK